MTYDLYNPATLAHIAHVDLEKAAEITEIADVEIVWAIEVDGQCDTADWIIVEHGDVPTQAEG